MRSRRFTRLRARLHAARREFRRSPDHGIDHAGVLEGLRSSRLASRNQETPQSNPTRMRHPANRRIASPSYWKGNRGAGSEQGKDAQRSAIASLATTDKLSS